MITPEKLHEWYLEAITNLNGNYFNHMADRPYEMLTEGQKFIDRYIADKILSSLAEEVGRLGNKEEIECDTCGGYGQGYNQAIDDVLKMMRGEVCK